MCPACPYVGREYSTCVDALLMDVAAIDDFARLRYTNVLHNTIYVGQYFSAVFTIDILKLFLCSIREWFENSQSVLSQIVYHRHGVPSAIAARLIFADFPTSMLVHGLHIPLQEGEVCISQACSTSCIST